MFGKPAHRIIQLDRMPYGIAITFADQRTILFHEKFLHAVRDEDGNQDLANLNLDAYLETGKANDNEC